MREYMAVLGGMDILWTYKGNKKNYLWQESSKRRL